MDGCWCGAAVNAGVVLLFGGDGCWCGAAVQCWEWCRLVEDARSGGLVHLLACSGGWNALHALLLSSLPLLSCDLNGGGGASTTKKSIGWKMRDWNPWKGLGRGNRRGVSSFRVIDCSLTLPRLSLFFIFGILFTPKNLI
uniref:Candidate secreted effector n=1 Tax=Meloidogyne incognita TaxID=6306 RepID=A0A914KHY5_MELIC